MGSEKPETASRLRGRLERVLDAAKVAGHREGDNPARWRGHLQLLLPKRVDVARHHKAMPYADLPEFYEILSLSHGAAAAALRFTILTAARTSETLEARWHEIDIDKGLWTVPAGRMKAKKEHRVPLSVASLDLLAYLADEIGDAPDDYVFPGAVKRSSLSNMAMAVVMKRKKAPYTVHGFRSAFRDWVAEETEFHGDIAEKALAHTIRNKVEAAYRRGDMLEKRRDLMEAWGEHVTGVDDGK